MPGHNIVVKQISNGTDMLIPSGHYLEAYLPRTVFPAHQPVTVESVQKLSPLLASKFFPAGFDSQLCGTKADIINKVLKKNEQTFDEIRHPSDPQDQSIPMSSPDTNEAVAFPIKSLFLANGSLKIKDVLVERVQDGSTADSTDGASCDITEEKVSNQNIASINDIRTSEMVQSFENNKTEINNVIKWAELQVSLRAKEDKKPIDEYSECCQAFVSRALRRDEIGKLALPWATP